jgi:hypothetical protein
MLKTALKTTQPFLGILWFLSIGNEAYATDNNAADKYINCAINIKYVSDWQRAKQPLPPEEQKKQTDLLFGLYNKAIAYATETSSKEYVAEKYQLYGAEATRQAHQDPKAYMSKINEDSKDCIKYLNK